MAAVWTARTVVELYKLVAWSECDVDMAAELLADNLVRHGVGEVTTLTNAESVQQVVDFWRSVDSLHLDLKVVLEGDDGEHVAIVFDSTITAKDGNESSLAGIEVFRVVDGKITEIWNCSFQQGLWN
jgi:predicted SnoaL-like aldol condensation-catalyzing enzyme